MNIKKTAITLAAIFGFALLIGGCSGTDQSNNHNNNNKTNTPTKFDNTVSQWQNGSVTYINGPDLPAAYDGNLNAAPALYDVDNNGTLDLVVGDASGYITIMINDSHDGINIVNSYMIGDASGPSYFCADAAPAVFDAGDGYWDLIVGCGDGTAMYLDFYDLTPGAMVALEGPAILDGTTLVLAGGYAVPTVGHFSDANDSLYDVVIGAGDGSVNYYINSGTLDAPEFTTEFRVGVFGTRAAVASGDLNADGLSDFVVGNAAGDVYACQGLTAECDLVLNTGSLAKPAVGDFNHDGLMDLVIGSADGSIKIITASR